MGGRFAYVSCGDEREIAVYRLDGAMATRVAVTQIPGATAPSGTSPLAVSPDRRYLYAALRDPPYPVATFAIDAAEGTLTWRGTADLPASMAAIATDRSGRWLVGASYGDAVVAATPIGPSGMVGRASAQIARTSPKAHSVAFSPDNRFLYAACLGGDEILCWRFLPGLGIAEIDYPDVTKLRAGAGPRHMALRATALYVVNELDGTIDYFARNEASGKLTHRQTIAALAGEGGAAAADIHLTPDGRYLYASVRRDSTIAAFGVGAADGTLTLIDRFAVETTPRSFAIDPDGKFLLCAGRDAAAFGVYAIDAATGKLAPVARHETSPNPNWVEILDL